MARRFLRRCLPGGLSRSTSRGARATRTRRNARRSSRFLPPRPRCLSRAHMHTEGCGPDARCPMAPRARLRTARARSYPHRDLPSSQGAAGQQLDARGGGRRRTRLGVRGWERWKRLVPSRLEACCANRLFARAMSIVPGRKKAAAGGAVRSSSFGRRKGGASTNASPVNSRRSQSTPAERYSPRVDTSLPWRPPQTRCSGGVGRVAKPAPTLALCTSLARWASPPRPLQCRSMEVCDAPGVG